MHAYSHHIFVVVAKDLSVHVDTSRSNDVYSIPAPPGMENAPISSYALPGVPIPASTSSVSKRERENDSNSEQKAKKNVSSNSNDKDDSKGSVVNKGANSALSGLANYDDDSD